MNSIEVRVTLNRTHTRKRHEARYAGKEWMTVNKAAFDRLVKNGAVEVTE